MRRYNVDPQWERFAAQWPQWRRLRSYLQEFEDQRKAKLDAKRGPRKARPTAAIKYHYQNGALTCPQCACSFAAKIGYIRRLRAHERQIAGQE